MLYLDDLDIKYHSGKTNVNADALSHNHSRVDGSNEKKEALCHEVSSHSSDNANLDHLTNAMKEIVQQKLQEIKAQQRKGFGVE